LSHIRETQAVVVVLRVFENPEIIHVEETVDPIRDLEIINTELILKDLDVVEKRLNSLEAEARRGDKKAQKNLEILKQVQDSLVRNNLITQFANEEIVMELQLLTSKKQIYLLNGSKEDVKPDLEKKIKDIGADYVVFNLAEDQNISELIKKSYQILNLISFFTTGEDETRAWTIRRGALAPEAAGTIHTDFEKKFIRAEVISTEKLLETGDWVKAKQKGLIRLEGKEYEVKDGDVLVIRHG
jgi:ribosome-binding ATPase YchF (GTP1/OBG family)